MKSQNENEPNPWDKETCFLSHASLEASLRSHEILANLVVASRTVTAIDLLPFDSKLGEVNTFQLLLRRERAVEVELV